MVTFSLRRRPARWLVPLNSPSACSKSSGAFVPNTLPANRFAARASAPAATSGGLVVALAINVRADVWVNLKL